MKKIFYIFIFVFTLFTVTDIYAKGEVVNAMSTVYEDITGTTSTLYADAKEGVKTVYNDSKHLIKDAYPEVKAAVVSIGQSIGCAAEHVYTVLVKKYIVDGFVELIWMLLSGALFIYGFININAAIKKSEYLTWKLIFPVIYTITGVILLLNVDYQTMLMGLINPEWGAINYILEYTKTML